MGHSKSIRLRAFAKINLGLQIIGERDDGYHSIETILHRIDLYDTLNVRRADRPEITVDCSHPGVPADATNLCYKAADIFFREIEMEPAVDIRLEKSIPVGAGLGGGSADAAAVLHACNTLFGMPLSDDLLCDLSSQIGSDIPYFIRPGSAYATGRGERLEYLKIKLPYWIVLVHPRIIVSTKWAYRQFSPNSSIKQQDLPALVTEKILDPKSWVNSLRNDFEPIVFKEYPIVMRVKEALMKGGADFALMSGSGSSVFGLFQDEHYARDIARELKKSYDVWITPPFFTPESSETGKPADV
jgi:4-diphosphocytidyl-2-C-methyl-D-erythritol kinase